MHVHQFLALPISVGTGGHTMAGFTTSSFRRCSGSNTVVVKRSTCRQPHVDKPFTVHHVTCTVLERRTTNRFLTNSPCTVALASARMAPFKSSFGSSTAMPCKSVAQSLALSYAATITSNRRDEPWQTSGAGYCSPYRQPRHEPVSEATNSASSLCSCVTVLWYAFRRSIITALLSRDIVAECTARVASLFRQSHATTRITQHK